MDKDFKILSYNSTGMAPDRVDFVKSIIDKYEPDVIMLQETWLIDSRLGLLGGINPFYLSNGIPAVMDNELLAGRPKWGLGMLWNRTICKNVKFVTIPFTKRACALELRCDDGCYVFINVYMPVDNYSKTNVNDEFQDTLDAIELFIQQCAGKYIVLGGDINSDFTRQNAHDKCFLDFLERNSCVHVYGLQNCVVDYTYNNPNNDCFTCIDHFGVSNYICQSVKSVVVCREPLNPSYHLPVIVTLACDTERLQMDEVPSNNHVPIAWYKVSNEDVELYHVKQNNFVANMRVYDAAACHDSTCNGQDHRNQLDLWCRDLIKCCLISDCKLPRIKARKSKRPRWNVDVKPYKDDCEFWHKLWSDAGYPRQGVLYDVKKYTKRQYMYANRRNKRKEDILRKERMADCIANNADRDFFKEIKRYEPRVTTNIPIDNRVKPIDVAENFASKYRALYNSVPSSQANMNDVYSYVNQCENVKDADRVISIVEVNTALKSIKSNKSDGDVHFMSNHLLISSQEFLVQISLLLSSILTHGYQPHDILKGSIESIPKNVRGNLCDSSNYRGITLCNSISKIFDIVILNKYGNLLATSDMQYAFKDKHSTVMCTLVMKEVVKYYSNHATDVFSCFVDATKAFDLVRYDKLFSLLIRREVPPIVLRALLDLYERQQLCTRWKGHVSELFSTSNGIRQGGVISPVLFCVYLDELLLRLEQKRTGCYIGKHFYGAIGYADDLTLLSPTISGLNEMLSICEDFSREYSIRFNPTKSVCMVFSKKKYDIQNIKLNGNVLTWVNSVKYLGNHLDCDMSESTEIRMKKSDLTYRVNHLLASIGNCSNEIVSKVFNTKCSHFYGAQCWNFEDKNVLYFQTMWNRCIRRLMNLPYTTHTRFLPLLNGTCSAIEQIYSRFLSLVKTMLNSTNVRVNYLARRSINDATSIIGANLHVIATQLNCEKLSILTLSKCQVKNMFLVKYENSIPAVCQIKELKNVLEGKAFITGFNTDEIRCIHNFLCTN